MTDQAQDDVTVFGTDQWIYCTQHRRPHKTGWCTVPVLWKVGLGIEGTGDFEQDQALTKCRELGLAIGDTQRAAKPLPAGIVFQVTIDSKAWDKFMKRLEKRGVSMPASDAIESIVAAGLTQDQAPDTATSTSIMMVAGRIRARQVGTISDEPPATKMETQP